MHATSTSRHPLHTTHAVATSIAGGITVIYDAIYGGSNFMFNLSISNLAPFLQHKRGPARSIDM